MTDLIDTTEMYLRTIYELEEENIIPLRARISERIGHSGPTVSQTVARMERDGLVVVEGDRHLRLTEDGHRKAVRGHAQAPPRRATAGRRDRLGLGARARGGLPLGKAVLAHDCPTAFCVPSEVNSEVPVTLDHDEPVALHARDRLRDRGTGMADTLADARAQRHDALFLELEDRPKIHLRGVNEVRHRCVLLASSKAKPNLCHKVQASDPSPRICLMAELTIPAELLPVDGRFGCGPSKVRPAQLASLARAGVLGTSHRQAPVQGTWSARARGLAELF